MTALVLTHAAATLFMTGVIWIVQIVHYPLFAGVGADGFANYAVAHARSISFVVLPAMLIELGAAAALAVRPGGAPTAAYVGLALLSAIWLSTFFVQVPLHERLAAGFDADIHRKLIDTNWLRTVLWSARSAVALYIVHGAMNGRLS